MSFSVTAPRSLRTWLVVLVALAFGVLAVHASGAAAATPQTLNLKVLLVGQGPTDVTTAAWAAALTSEGVPYTEVDATGTAPSESIALPTLSSGSVGNYNGVIIADSPTNYAAGQLTPLFSYESAFGVRQVDGYMYPSATLGANPASAGVLDGTTSTLTTAGLAAFPQLKGTVPFDTGTYGYGATAVAGANYTPLLTDASGNALAGVFVHPTNNGDPQGAVSELSLYFDYNSNQMQWLLLSPGLINWVTQNTHLGLYRNYFGQDVDDLFIADNEWSSQYQCTPAATNPPDYTCPVAQQGVAPGTNGAPPDVQMSAADVAYVVNWEKQTGITLNFAFNAVGACTAPSVAAESSANCTGSVTENGATYTDPGQVIDPSAPNDAAFVNALLAAKNDFNWMTHTWSHLFLGCTVGQPQALTSVTPNGSGGSFTAGAYSYEITAATAYGESEPSVAKNVTVNANGSVNLTWPEATNGTGTNGTPGPTLAQEAATHTGGSGFWGYYVYRENPGSTAYGLVGQVAENPAATAATTYSFTDTGATAPGAAPNSGPQFPTATNPGIDCSSAPGSWLPATSTAGPDNSIEQEIGLDQAFAAANGIPNYSPAVVVTGEHSGIDNPNMPAALAGVGVTTFAQDASRQPQQYSLGNALGAPRYPSNIAYNASTWPDQLNEYNTLYVAPGVNLGDATYPNETGRCTSTSATTCITTPATEATMLGSESHIMLSHILANNPRMGYAHQSNLIGPAQVNGVDYGYTLLTLINNMLSQYNSYYNASAPLSQITDFSSAQTLAQQGAWTTALAGGKVTATDTNGVVTVTNGGLAVGVPVTVPTGTTVNGAAFGSAYGGMLSGWSPIASGASQTLNLAPVAPAFTSSTTATSIVGAAFSTTVHTTGIPTAAITETGALPTGLSLVDNGDGTATIAGTPAAGTGGSYPITISATNSAGTTTQSFVLTNAEAPTITSAATATFSTGVVGSYQMTTTGYPTPTLTETGALPLGMNFIDNGNGSATISGTPDATATGTYPVTLSATNASGSTATLSLVITVVASSPPTITSGASGFFTLNQAGAIAITTTGSPTPTITETGAMPPGLTFTDGGKGTALIQGTPTTTGTTTLTVTAHNGIGTDATQTVTIIVGQPPAFTSASTAPAQINTPFSFTVTTSGYPAPAFGWSNVPPGLSVTDNHDGTLTISGTPTTDGTYTMPLTATSAYGTAQQTLTIGVVKPPAITSPEAATFATRTVGTFTVTTTGNPAATITETGALPAGVTLVDNHDGTAILSGTPPLGAGGSYPITITAANGVGAIATQSFLLTVSETPTAPTITSPAAASTTIGRWSSFEITSTAAPVAKLTETGSLPSGVVFADNGNGTATLSGAPIAGTAGSYPITITAANGVGTNATQNLVLTVNAELTPPDFSNAAATTFAAGKAGTFPITSTGNPTPTLTFASSPALPSGVSITNNNNGTATLAGTAPAGSQGVYMVTITAANSEGTAAMTLALTVNSGLSITSPGSASATAGKAFTFTVTTTGTPAASLGETGTLPSGVTFRNNNNGTATLSGTPASTSGGTYPLTITATNSTGSASQAFVLTVAQAPSFTSATTATETAGTAFGFTVAASGSPRPTLTAGTLPAGVSFSDNGTGTGLLSGTTATTAGTYRITLTATNAGGTTTQTFTLTVKAAGTSTGQKVPSFTSAAAATATAGTTLNFNVTTLGVLPTILSESGTLPSGITFRTNINGTATLSGNPSTTAGGVYPITLTATNSVGTVTQAFVLTVNARPSISTGTSAAATVGSTFNFTVRANGAPTPNLTESGALPQGVTFLDNNNGTATLAGTPGVAQGGVYRITITATNTLGSTSQTFTLTVSQAPSITSAAAATATHAKAFSFTFTSAGYPAATLTRTGTVAGLTFTAGANGTATLSGTPTTAGTYSLTITATNSVGTATQTFVLTVT